MIMLTRTLPPQLPSERASIRISEHSVWTDKRWHLAVPAPGNSRRGTTIDWDFKMPDGTAFCDPDWYHLLEAAKLFLWSLHADPPPHARSLFLRTLSKHFIKLRILIR